MALDPEALGLQSLRLRDGLAVASPVVGLRFLLALTLAVLCRLRAGI